MKAMKKILSFLERNDGIWSIPLSFFILIGGNLLLNRYFGEPIISLEYVQPLAMVALVMVCLNAIAYLGCNLNQKELQRYFYSEDSGRDMNRWGVNPFYRVLLYLVIYLVYFLIGLFLFIYFSNLWFLPANG
jgi:hypothetical protein